MHASDKSTTTATKWHVWGDESQSIATIHAVAVLVTPVDQVVPDGWEEKVCSLMSSVQRFHERELEGSALSWSVHGPITLPMLTGELQGEIGANAMHGLSCDLVEALLQSAPPAPPEEESAFPLPCCVAVCGPSASSAHGTPSTTGAGAGAALAEGAGARQAASASAAAAARAAEMVCGIVFANWGQEVLPFPCAPALQKYFIYKNGRRAGMTEQELHSLLKPITCTGGSRACYLGRRGVGGTYSSRPGQGLGGVGGPTAAPGYGYGVGLVTQEAWLCADIPLPRLAGCTPTAGCIPGCDAVVAHEGLGHAIGMPHPQEDGSDPQEPLCVMGRGMYAGLPISALCISAEIKKGMVLGGPKPGVRRCMLSPTPSGGYTACQLASLCLSSCGLPDPATCGPDAHEGGLAQGEGVYLAWVFDDEEEGQVVCTPSSGGGCVGLVCSHRLTLPPSTATGGGGGGGLTPAVCVVCGGGMCETLIRGDRPLLPPAATTPTPAPTPAAVAAVGTPAHSSVALEKGGAQGKSAPLASPRPILRATPAAAYFGSPTLPAALQARIDSLTRAAVARAQGESRAQEERAAAAQAEAGRAGEWPDVEEGEGESHTRSSGRSSTASGVDWREVACSLLPGHAEGGGEMAMAVASVCHKYSFTEHRLLRRGAGRAPAPVPTPTPSGPGGGLVGTLQALWSSGVSLCVPCVIGQLAAQQEGEGAGGGIRCTASAGQEQGQDEEGEQRAPVVVHMLDAGRDIALALGAPTGPGGGSASWISCQGIQLTPATSALPRQQGQAQEVALSAAYGHFHRGRWALLPA